MKAFFKVVTGIMCLSILLSAGWINQVEASPFLDLTQVDGFPRTEPGTIDFAGPAVVDLNRDGRFEVLVADSGGCVWGWDRSGNALPGFPLKPFGGCGVGTRINSFAVGNIDSDSTLEVVAGTAGEGEQSGQRGKVHAWNADGSRVSGWPKEMAWNVAHGTGQAEVYSVVLANVAGDARLEVLAGTSNNSSSGGTTTEASPNLYAWNGRGELLAGFPTWYRRGGIYGMLGAGDLNSDGCMDIVAPRDHRWLHAYNGRGQYLRGWPVETWVDPSRTSAAPYLEFTRNAPAVADLNKDGVAEVIAAGRVKQSESVTGGQTVIINSGVGVFKPDGDRFSGWRVARLGDGPAVTNSYDPSQAPAMGDLNGDGQLEVVVALMDGTIRAYKSNGDQMWKYSFAQGRKLAASEPVIGDIDGDRQLDIVFGTYSPDGSANSSVGLLALNASGGMKGGFPLALTNENGQKKGIRAAPVLSDLDGDGKVEIVAGSWSGVVYVWNTDGPFRSETMPWPTGRQNNQRTGSIIPRTAAMALDGVIEVIDEIVEPEVISDAEAEALISSASSVSYTAADFAFSIVFPALPFNKQSTQSTCR